MCVSQPSAYADHLKARRGIGSGSTSLGSHNIHLLGLRWTISKVSPSGRTPERHLLERGLPVALDEPEPGPFCRLVSTLGGLPLPRLQRERGLQPYGHSGN